MTRLLSLLLLIDSAVCFRPVLSNAVVSGFTYPPSLGKSRQLSPPAVHRCMPQGPVMSASLRDNMPKIQNWWPRRGRAVAATLFASTLLTRSSACLAAAAAAGSGAEHLHLGQKIAAKLATFGLPDEVVVLLISALPAIELRGAVPVGNWLGLSPQKTFITSIVGNMVPIALVLLALRSDFVQKLMAPLLRRAERKLGNLGDDQSRFWALAVFVGIPLPGTGAWTGAFGAFLLGMPYGVAMASILAGVVMAGVIMTALTLAGWAGAAVAGAALVIFGIMKLVGGSKEEEEEPLNGLTIRLTVEEDKD